MGVVFLVVVGATLGWLTAILMQAENAWGMLRNGAVGIGGALLAGLGLNPLLGQGDLLHGSYSVDALLVSLAGSVMLLCMVNLPRLRAQR